MRMLVLGAGQQGTACALDLLERTDHEVVLADARAPELPPFLAPHVGNRLRIERVDARDPASIRRVLDGVSATMSALPYYLNLEIARVAIEAGSHFADLGGNTEIVIGQKRLSGRAVEQGVSVVPDCGLAPGMVNILAEHGIRQLDRPRSVRIMVGGLPQNPAPPLGYQIVYSLEGVLDYYTTDSWVLRDGAPLRVRALSEVEEVHFPGVGALEAFHTAGGLSTMAQRYEGVLDTMEYKTLRYPGHARTMEAIRELGLLSTEPVTVGGAEVSPRALFLAVAGPRLRKDPRSNPDLVALRVEVEGEHEGAPVSLRWDLLDRFDAARGVTAMMRTTGYSLAIIALLQLEGAIAPGVATPDEAVPAPAYVDALRERGVVIQHTRS